MSQYVPQIGTTGLYSLLPPFNTQLVADTLYSCIAVRKLSDILAAGGDPFAEFYEPHDIDASKYEADVAMDVCIVSLQAGSHVVLRVPSSYITGLPNIGGVPYLTMALGISLGSIPNKLDLTYIKSKIRDDVAEYMGVESEIHEMAISLPILLSNEQAQIVETARQAKIGTVVTDWSKYLAEKALRESAEQRIQELEAFIKANHIVV